MSSKMVMFIIYCQLFWDKDKECKSFSYGRTRTVYSVQPHFYDRTKHFNVILTFWESPSLPQPLSQYICIQRQQRYLDVFFLEIRNLPKHLTAALKKNEANVKHVFCYALHINLMILTLRRALSLEATTSLPTSGVWIIIYIAVEALQKPYT